MAAAPAYETMEVRDDVEVECETGEQPGSQPRGARRTLLAAMLAVGGIVVLLATVGNAVTTAPGETDGRALAEDVGADLGPSADLNDLLLTEPRVDVRSLLSPARLGNPRDLGKKKKNKKKRNKNKKEEDVTEAPEEGHVPEGGCGAAVDSTECAIYDNCRLTNKGVCKYDPVAKTRLLFIGNSFTIRNSLPTMVTKMGHKSGKNVLAAMSAFGSATFIAHLDSTFTTGAMDHPKIRWNSIVLQEQSFFLSEPQSYWTRSIKPGRQLYNIGKENTDRFILYETWGYRYGNPGFFSGLDDNYSKMQDRLYQGYSTLQTELLKLRETDSDAAVSTAHVGEAWRLAFPSFEDKLYTGDARHPDVHGTYLAACVMFAEIFGESPIGNKYVPKGVTKAEAALLQGFANEIAFGSP